MHLGLHNPWLFTGFKSLHQELVSVNPGKKLEGKWKINHQQPTLATGTKIRTITICIHGFTAYVHT